MKKNNKGKSNIYLPPLKRRDFLRRSAGGMAGAWLSSWPWQKLAAQQDLNFVSDDWDSGIVTHLLPSVNESRMLIKTSFSRALDERPQLQIQNGSNNRLVEGFLNDTIGEFWQFYVDELRPDTEYELSLQDNRGNPLCESWPLSTLSTKKRAK